MPSADDAEDATVRHPAIAKMVAGLVAVALIGWGGATSASADEVSILTDDGAAVSVAAGAAVGFAVVEPGGVPEGDTASNPDDGVPGSGDAAADSDDVESEPDDVESEPDVIAPEPDGSEPEPEVTEPDVTEPDLTEPEVTDSEPSISGAEPETVVPELEITAPDPDDANAVTSQRDAAVGANGTSERAAIATAATVCTATTQPQLDACFAQTATDLDIVINPVSGTNINRNTGLTDFRITIPAGQNVTISGASSGFRITGVYFVVNGSLTITGLGLITNSTQTAAQQLPLVQVNSGGVFTLDNGGSITGNGSGAINAASGATVDILTGSTISGNTGAGAINLLSGSTLTMSGGTISGNTSTTGGGAINMAAGSIATITGGTISGNSSSNGGGAINLLSGASGATPATLNMSGGTISGNSSSTGGGAINLGSGATLNLTGGTLSNNTATGTADGGAILVSSANQNRADVTISDTTFSDNQAAGGSGGGIFIGNWSTLTLADCTFTQNVAGIGGAIGSGNNVTVTLEGSVGNQLTGNQATNNGGAIEIGTNSSFTVAAGTVFSGNSVTGTGGAISVGTSTTTSITGSTFQSNTATTNGGAVIFGGETTSTITGSSFLSNSAGTSGGAIYLSQGYTNLQVTGSSGFTGNTATTAGGAIWLRYISPAAGGNELANLFITDAVTFSGNSAGTAAPIRNPLDDAIYESNIAATVWSNDQSGTPMLQGYNNYDIAYSYTPTPAEFPAAPFPMPFTGETITIWPWIATGLVILVVGAYCQAKPRRQLLK